MHTRTVLQERRLFHYRPPRIHKQDVENINKILNKRKLILEVKSPHPLAEVVCCPNPVSTQGSLDLSEKISIVVIFRNFHIFLGVLDYLFGQIIMQIVEKMMSRDEPAP